MRLRPLFSRLHLYLALTVGIMLVLAGVTGSILVFHEQLDAWLNPTLLTAFPDNRQSLPYETILADARHYLSQEAHAESYHITGIDAPLHATSVVTVWYQFPEEQGNLQHELYMDPYSGTIQGERIFGRDFISWIYLLHTSLCMGASGKLCMGYVGLCCIVLLLSGFLLWLPRRGQARYMFTFRPSRAPFIKLQDIHRLTGIYAVLSLMMSCITGVCMQFPQATHNVMGMALPVSPPLEQIAVQSTGNKISLDTAIDTGKAEFPGSVFNRVYFPVAENGSWLLTFTPLQDPNRHNGYNRIVLNPYTGAIERKQDWNNAPAGDVVMEWVFPLHSGEAFSVNVKMMWCVVGLAPLLLIATGLLCWNRKSAGRKKTVR